MPGGGCWPSARSLSEYGPSLWTLATQGGLKAAGSLSRSYEASRGLCWEFCQSHFSVCWSKQVTSSAQSFGGVEKEDVHSREKSNNSIANMMEEFMAIFIIYHHLQIWKVYFLLMLHVCCGLRGVLLHIIPHEEMWDEGFLLPPRICWVGFPCWGKDSSEESCRKWDASVQEWQESLNQSPSKVSDKVTPDLRGVGGNVFIMHL